MSFHHVPDFVRNSHDNPMIQIDTSPSNVLHDPKGAGEGVNALIAFFLSSLSVVGPVGLCTSEIRRDVST